MPRNTAHLEGTANFICSLWIKTMTLQTFDPCETAFIDPTRIKCACGKSAVLLPLPHVHCVKCHETYTSRTLGYPAFCARCGYNLRAWRARNNITAPVVPFP